MEGYFPAWPLRNANTKMTLSDFLLELLVFLSGLGKSLASPFQLPSSSLSQPLHSLIISTTTMQAYTQVRLDDQLLASLELVLNLDSTLYWAQSQGDSSPPLPLSPEAPGSPLDLEAFEGNEEGWMDQEKCKFTLFDQKTPLERDRKKRGRRPLRPFDPIKKKTEEKDKYWLRGFRAYMKAEYNHIRAQISTEDRVFWREYLSIGGKPEKGNAYLSYGKKYKDFLFSHKTFTELFRDWFVTKGEQELAKKCEPNSDLWFVFYDYGVKELLPYEVNSATSSPELFPSNSKSPSALYDFTMVDSEDLVDSLLA